MSTCSKLRFANMIRLNLFQSIFLWLCLLHVLDFRSPSRHPARTSWSFPWPVPQVSHPGARAASKWVGRNVREEGSLHNNQPRKRAERELDLLVDTLASVAVGAVYEHDLISITTYWMTVIHIPFTQFNVTSIGLGYYVILTFSLYPSWGCYNLAYE